MNEHASVSPLDKPVMVTRWANVLARKPSAAKPISLQSLTKALEERHAATKDDPVKGLSLLKLSAFGDTPNENGYLRHGANLADMHGVELDYDDEAISLDEGKEVLTKANIGCTIYTSPSHTPEAPRWRILAPLSQPLSQDQRGLLLGRIAGAFHAAGYGNPFSSESWVPVTCYYYGYVDGKKDSHRVEPIDGSFIDTLDELDNEHWQPAPLHKPRKDASGKTIPGEQGPMDLDLAHAILADTGDGIHGALVALAGKLVNQGWSWDDIYADLMHRIQTGAGRDPRHRRHKRWLAVSSDRRKEVSNIITGVFKLDKDHHPGIFSSRSEQDTPGSGSSKDRTETEQGGDDGGGDQPGQDEDTKTHDDEPKATRQKPKAWLQLLQRNKTGFIPNEFNVVIVLTHAPETAGAIAYDAFRARYTVLRAMPWSNPGEAFPRQWTDNDDVGCAVWLQGQGLQVKSRLIPGPMNRVAIANSFNPLQDWLTSLTWDRTPRIDTWLTDFFGAENTLATREFGRRFLLSAVARAMSPGCKADCMLVLEGIQGALKSTVVETLAGEEFYGSLSGHDVASKDAMMQMCRVWIIEVPELDKLSRQDAADVKTWLGTRVDSFRPPYGRAVVDHRRGCVVIGTTNKSDYLTDETGNRRFWPVKVGHIDLQKLIAEREQLWAEALDRQRAGEPWHITDKHAQEAAEEAQRGRVSIDEAWTEIIQKYLDGTRAVSVTINEILEKAVELEPAKRVKASEMTAGRVLTLLGWVKRHTKKGNVWEAS